MSTFPIRWSVLILVLGASAPSTAMESWPKTLPDTDPLELLVPLDVLMVDGISQFAEREVNDSRRRREEIRQQTGDEWWSEDRLSARRARLRTIIGAVDDRVEARLSAEIGELPSPSPHLSATPVSWTVLEGMTAEGLLVVPENQPRAAVILVPDATWTPEQLVVPDPGGAAPYPVASWLAANDCLVLIPSLINREQEFSGHPDIRSTNLSHREYVYRMAFEMGRHVIGYEVQKILAAADYLDAKLPSVPIGVWGAGEGGLLAMYAAALDERFDACATSGYFQEREGVWREPIDRNVWSLLREFGDAEIAGLIAPRPCIIEVCRVPEVSIPPQDQQEGTKAAAPGRIDSPSLDAAQAEFMRARVHFEALDADGQLRLVASPDAQGRAGQGEAFSEGAKAGFLEALGFSGAFVQSASVPLSSPVDARARQQRQIREMVLFTQRLLHSSDKVRATFWQDANRSSVNDWVESAETYRSSIHEQMIGRLPPPELPARPRSRMVLNEPEFVGYEVVLDLYRPEPQTDSGSDSNDPGIIAGGILLLPNDLKDGEQRPVVVFQHGLEGTPMDTITTDESARAWDAYKGVSRQLVERGFIVYAPQNPYRGEDRFRVIQRKSNPLGRSLFSYIIEQHRQTLRWLATLPWTDPERIAFYGLSYGGKTAVRVPPLLADDNGPEYCLSICSADFNEWIRKNVSHEDRYSYVYTREYEMFEWNMGHVADYAELASLMTPRPFMVERGHNDGVAPDEWVAWEFAKVRRHYAGLGLSDRVEIEFFDGPHTINGKGTFAFLHRHLDWPPPAQERQQRSAP